MSLRRPGLPRLRWRAGIRPAVLVEAGVLGLFCGAALVAAPVELRDCPQCPTMVALSDGRFTMGTADSEEGRESDESPEHRVTIREPFAMGAFEVTRGQFAAFANHADIQVPAGCSYIDPQARKWVDDPLLSWRNPGFPQGDDHPVTCVNWDDATRYATWLSQQTGQSYRLPSEAEWEFAVRAGTVTSRFWGDSPADSCGYANAVDETARDHFPGWKFAPCEDGYLYTSPAGSFKANPWGLFDMPGNLWEWVEDCWQDSHLAAPGDGAPQRSGDCSRRVIRGGAWDDEHEDLRSGNRLAVPAQRRYNTIGIRLVRDL